MTANCEKCGAELMVVLDADERIELRFVSTDASGRAIYVVDVVPVARPAPRRPRA